MPLNRLLIIIAAVITAAALTVFVAVSLAQNLAVPPMTGIAIFSVIALCASYAVRRASDRKRDDT